MKEYNDIEHLALVDLLELLVITKKSVAEAMPEMREFRDKHNLNDEQTLRAVALAIKLFS